MVRGWPVLQRGSWSRIRGPSPPGSHFNWCVRAFHRVGTAIYRAEESEFYGPVKA